MLKKFGGGTISKYSDENLGVKHADHQHCGSDGDFEDDVKGVPMNRLGRRPGADEVV